MWDKALHYVWSPPPPGAFSSKKLPFGRGSQARRERGGKGVGRREAERDRAGEKRGRTEIYTMCTEFASWPELKPNGWSNNTMHGTKRERRTRYGATSPARGALQQQPAAVWSL